ncbi:hypothetical protein CW304_17205 [Bacillus sp. UFRGS-B20]|nr:hypothetical protein CW304_17205 [Bacillus sp. UFRGS-B20]
MCQYILNEYFFQSWKVYLYSSLFFNNYKLFGGSSSSIKLNNKERKFFLFIVLAYNVLLHISIWFVIRLLPASRKR